MPTIKYASEDPAAADAAAVSPVPQPLEDFVSLVAVACDSPAAVVAYRCGTEPDVFDASGMALPSIAEGAALPEAITAMAPVLAPTDAHYGAIAVVDADTAPSADKVVDLKCRSAAGAHSRPARAGRGEVLRRLFELRARLTARARALSIMLDRRARIADIRAAARRLFARRTEGIGSSLPPVAGELSSGPSSGPFEHTVYVGDTGRDRAAPRSSSADAIGADEYRALVEFAEDGLFRTTPAGRYQIANPALARMYGYGSVEEMCSELTDVGRQLYIRPEKRDEFIALIEKQNEVRGFESEVRRKDGTTLWISENARAIRSSAGELIGIAGSVIDISERKQNETSLAAVRQSVDVLVQGMPVVLFAFDTDGTLTLTDGHGVNPLGSVPHEMEGRNVFDLCAELPDICASYRRALSGEAFRSTSEYKGIWFETWYTPLVDESGKVTGVFGVGIDVTHQRRREAEICALNDQLETRLRRSNALRNVDHAITMTSDLRITLNIVIDKVDATPGVCAANVLLCDPVTAELSSFLARGLDDGLVRASVALGTGHVGRAALKRSTVAIPDRLAEPAKALEDDRLERVNFKAYYAIPLLAHGKLKGVLEVYFDEPVQRNDERIDFIDSLAGQSAIAIASAELVTGLRRSNEEMTAAYDATIEGWSSALDMRDKETDGHSRRVADITVRLAQAMGCSGDEIVAIRRGAVLHDIGKMGISDAILQKPGPLSEEEWVVMRRHPVLAYEWLSGILFLRNALDIPYCHHEKWDGSGYPNGLSGHAIPFAARLFAVVDVWDALRSDRPYRQRLSKAAALQQIRAGSGSHFDPQVVEAFIHLTETEPDD